MDRMDHLDRYKSKHQQVEVEGSKEIHMCNRRNCELDRDQKGKNGDNRKDNRDEEGDAIDNKHYNNMICQTC